MTAACAALAVLTLSLSAAETLPPGPAVAVPNPDMLQRAQALGREIRCPVCQGMPIGESPATMAQDMQAKVNQMVAQGASDGQVRDFFVARYGEWVLLDPPRHGVTLWLWVLPWAFLSLGLAIAWRAIAAGRRARPGPAAGAAKVAAAAAGGDASPAAAAGPLPAGAPPSAVAAALPAPSPALLDQIRRESEP